MMGKDVIVIDGKDHLLGRLASIIAKQLLCGQQVVVIKCEELNISGSLFRAKMKYKSFLRKRTLTNPKKGPFHHRAPSKIFWRAIRGMIPHKTKRGEAAMERLKVFDGTPKEWASVEKMTVPIALRETRLKPGRKWTVLGQLSHEVGWKHYDAVARLENKLKAESAQKVESKEKTLSPTTSKAIAEIDRALAAFGY